MAGDDQKGSDEEGSARPSARRSTERTKKPSAKRPSAKRPSAKRPSAKRASAKRGPAKKAPTEKAPAEKAPTKGVAAEKASTKGVAAEKAAAGEPSSKRPAAKKPSAKKPSAKKPASRRSSRQGRAARPSEPPRQQAIEAAADATDVSDAASGDGAVLVTGICGRLGRLLARRLHRSGRVVGVDRRPFRDKPKDVVHHQLDVRRKKTRDIFRGGDIRAVVHLGVLHDPRASDKEHHSWNVVAFQKLLDYLAQYDVPKLVVLSSANVYGPQPDNPQFLTEEAPLLGAQSFRNIRDLVELDMLAQSFFWRHPQTETVILRPCHILGGVRNAASNYLRLERPMTLLGFDPMVQVVHERDVVQAIALALEPGVRGIFNLRGPGELPLSRVFERLGRRPRSIPGPLAKGALDRMWRYRLTSFPPPELDHIRYVCMVDDSRARQTLGYHPRYDLDETLSAVDSDR